MPVPTKGYMLFLSLLGRDCASLAYWVEEGYMSVLPSEKAIGVLEQVVVYGLILVKTIIRVIAVRVRQTNSTCFAEPDL